MSKGISREISAVEVVLEIQHENPILRFSRNATA